MHFKAVFNNKFKNSIVRSDAPKALLSDEQYEALVEEKIKEMDVINLGLNRLGLDESQVKEIKPVIVKDKIVKNKTSLLVYNPSDNSLHSSTQYVTILYLTDSQLFQYDIKFDMCCNYKEEATREIFYDDICDVSTHLEKVTHDNNILNSFSVKQESYRPEQIINSEVSKAKFEENIMSCYIFTSNSVFNFAVNDSDLEKVFSIKAMMQKIRDKKNA